MTEIKMPNKPDSYMEFNAQKRLDKIMDAIAEVLESKPLTEKDIRLKLMLDFYSYHLASNWIKSFLISGLLSEDKETKLITLTKDYSVFHKCLKDNIKEFNIAHPEIFT